MNFLPLTTLGPSSPLSEIARRYSWTVPLVASLGLLGSALEGAGIGMLIPLLSLLLQDNGLSNTPRFAQQVFEFLPSAPFWRLAGLAGFILLLVVMKVIVHSVNSVLISRIEAKAGADIRDALSHRMLRVPYPFFLENDANRLINIVASDSWRVTDCVRMIYGMTTAIAALCVFSVLLVFVHWQLFLYVTVSVLIIRKVQGMLSRRLKVLGDAVTQANHRLGEQMLHMVDSIRLVRLYGQEELEQKRFEEASESVRRAMFTVQKASAQMLPRLEVMQAVLFISVLLSANWFKLPVPTVTAFLVLLYRMQPHLASIHKSRLGFSALGGSVREVDWMLGRLEEVVPPVVGNTLTRIDKDIRFENVSYSYPKSSGEAALEAASFTIAAGTVTAVIGRSGSGKSTMINLLCRLMEPGEGAIRIGDQDIADLDSVSWRSRIALAGQDIDLFDGTIADNIAYGAKGKTVADIEQAAIIADADSFIRSLPDGYQSRVGSRGFGLSGGQRQRIGLARALLRQPDVLILDEATNAVDGISEMAIIALLEKHRHFKTAIVISHRRSTLAACQAGIVIADGRIVESGPLRDLKFYREMESEAEPISGGR